MWATMAGQYPIRSADNPSRVIEGEAVIVTPEDSMLHTLNPVGTFIWERADGSRSLDEIVDALCEAYEVERAQAAADAQAFVAECIERKVLALRDDPLPPTED